MAPIGDSIYKIKILVNDNKSFLLGHLKHLRWPYDRFNVWKEMKCLMSMQRPVFFFYLSEESKENLIHSKERKDRSLLDVPMSSCKITA